MSEVVNEIAEQKILEYEFALRRIVEACARPFGKDARRAHKIAKTVLEKFESSQDCPNGKNGEN